MLPLVVEEQIARYVREMADAEARFFRASALAMYVSGESNHMTHVGQRRWSWLLLMHNVRKARMHMADYVYAPPDPDCIAYNELERRRDVLYTSPRTYLLITRRYMQFQLRVHRMMPQLFSAADKARAHAYII
jgi:hypothetical protein